MPFLFVPDNIYEITLCCALSSVVVRFVAVGSFLLLLRLVILLMVLVFAPSVAWVLICSPCRHRCKRSLSSTRSLSLALASSLPLPSCFAIVINIGIIELVPLVMELVLVRLIVGVCDGVE